MKGWTRFAAWCGSDTILVTGPVIEKEGQAATLPTREQTTTQMSKKPAQKLRTVTLCYRTRVLVIGIRLKNVLRSHICSRKSDKNAGCKLNVPIIVLFFPFHFA